MLRDFRRLLLFAALFLIALAVRLYHIEIQSIWFDEGWSAYAATRPTLAAAAAADATNPPLYYMLLHIGVRAFGDSAFALRLVSALFGLLTIALAARLGGRLFGTRAALVAGFMTAFSPLLWWASQEARMYTLLATLVLIAALAWHRLLAGPSRWAWPSLWLAELGLLYAHNTGPVAALWLNVVTLVAWVAQRGPRRPAWLHWIVGQAAVAALWAPYFISRFVNLTAANSSIQSAPELDVELLGSLWQGLWSGSWSAIGHEPLLVALVWGAAVLCLLLIPWRRAAARWLALHFAVLVAGLVLGLMVLGNELHGRYLVMAAPLLLVAVAAGIARLRPALAGAGVLAYFAALFVVALVVNQNPLYGHDDAREMVRYYAETLTAGDTVLAWSYADRYELAYYWPRLGARAGRVTLPEGADMEAIIPLLPDDGAVALNVWYTQRADYRGMMNCLLSHGAARPPETFTVYGMMNLLYETSPAVLPQLQPAPVDFGVARLEAAGQIPAFTSAQALCLPLELTLTRPTTGELRAALIVTNALGWEVARANAVFATADQRTSDAARIGERLRAFPLLRLPYGAPSGEYRLLLRLYDEAEISGYPVLEPEGPPWREYVLGTWQAPPGQDWMATGRMPDLPYLRGDVTTGDLTLAAQSLSPAVQTRVTNGELLRIALLWQGAGALPELVLEAADGSWRVDIPAPARDRAMVTLDWREVIVPAGAETGEIALRLPDGTVVATLWLDAQPMLLEPPPYQHPIGAEFPGVGTLVGADFPADAVSIDAPVPVTLVWQAANDAPAGRPLTVFVQLLDGSGRVIAQSDMQPAAGARPTTGWRPDEYIVDAHELRWNENARPGVGRLIAGLYDAESGERVLLAGGGDAAELAAQVTVR
ncbi:MAG: glycosyltransferase family 39 protein [Chloroflexota bacterium]